MHITEVINNLEIGGAERMVADLSAGLHARGHQLSVVCLRGAGPLAAVLEQAGVPVVALNKGSGFSTQSVRMLAQHLRSTGADIVHTHNPLVHHYGLLAARMAGVPVTVNTLHGPGNLQGVGKTEVLFEVSCLFSDAVVACCNAVHNHLRKVTSIARRRSTVIRNGICMDRFIDTQPAQHSGEVVFGTVGRLVPVKDHRTLLKAFARARQTAKNIRLEILGNGPLSSELSALAESLGVSESVRFHGSHLDVPAFLRRIDVFVLCSLSEGLPLTVLEAMAAARPIIGTSVGAIPELVTSAGCGWVCQAGNADELADRMLSAAQTPDLMRLGLQGRSHVLTEYSVQQMVSGYEGLFQDLLSKTHRACA